MNLHFLLDTLNTCSEKKKKKLWKNDFSAISCRSHLCHVCVKEWWDEEAEQVELWLKKKEEERNHVADFDRLISFGFIRLSPQKGRVTAISDWAAGGHVLNEQSQWSLTVTSSLAHNDGSQFKQCKK